MVKRCQGNNCFAYGVLAHSISQRFFTFGITASYAAGKSRESVVIEIDMGVINELIGSVFFCRIATCTLKGVAVAASLYVMAANGYRNFIFTIRVAVD